MVNSKGDTEDESEGYKTTNTYINPATETQTRIQINETTPTHKTTPPKEKPTATSTQPPKHKRTAKSPKEPHTSTQNTNPPNFKVESGW